MDIVQEFKDTFCC